MDQKRQQEIVQALEGIVEDGDGFRVECHDGCVDVEPLEESDYRLLSEENPELYGHLVAVSEILSDAGSNLVLFPMITVAVICLAIHMNWIDRFLGIDVDRIRSIWVYAIALTVCFFLCGQIALWVEGFAYWRYRDDLVRHIQEAGYSRWNLLARISQDEELTNVADKLKTDWRNWSNSGFGR